MEDLREEVEDMEGVETDNNPAPFIPVTNKKKSPKKHDIPEQQQQQGPQRSIQHVNNGPLRPTQQELEQVRAAERRDQQRKEYLHQQRLQQQQHQKQQLQEQSRVATQDLALFNQPQQQQLQQQQNPNYSASLLMAQQNTAKLHQKQMALNHARETRPEHPFESGTSIEYATHIRSFESATKGDALDSREKLLELAKWFKGSARRIINSYVVDESDPDGNLAKAKSELDLLFRHHRDSFTATIKQITRGKQIAEDDYKGHMDLYSQLKEAQSMVRATGSEAEFQRRDVIQEILHYRLAHLSKTFWMEDERRHSETGHQFVFDDLLVQIRKWLVVLANMGAVTMRQNNENNNNSGGKQMASANATTTYEGGNVRSQQAASQNVQEQSMAQRIANSSPKQQPTTRCGICDSLHDTSDCQLLANISVNERLQRLSEKGLCFHCFQRGHTAKFCTQKPRCQLCNRRHNTLMHQRRDEFLQGMQQKQMECQPMMQNAPPAPDTTMSTTNSHPSAPQPQNWAPQNAIPFQQFVQNAPTAQSMVQTSHQESAPPSSTHPVI